MTATPCSKTCHFFLHGTSQQFEAVLKHYDAALKAKAHQKSNKPENVLKLDKWYQNDLPKKIKSRGKDAHLTHEELVQTIKWKLARGKFFPQLTNLVRINTPKAVQSESRKAFRKLPNIEQAINSLTNLKGVGTTLASAVLAAGAPHLAPFMADECLLAMPDVDGLDYTMKEYMRLVEQVNSTVERLNAQGGNWNPHRVELAVWTFYIANELKPELLEGIGLSGTPVEKSNANGKAKEDSGNGKYENGGEDSNMSMGLSSIEDGSNLSAEDSNLGASISAVASSNCSSVSNDEDSNSQTSLPNSESNGKQEQKNGNHQQQAGENQSQDKLESNTNNPSTTKPVPPVESPAQKRPNPSSEDEKNEDDSKENSATGEPEAKKVKVGEESREEVEKSNNGTQEDTSKNGEEAPVEPSSNNAAPAAPAPEAIPSA